MSTSKMPFVYGTTVSQLAFTNREEDTLRLKENLLNGINTMLISPRRWGKSSLVEKTLQEIRSENRTAFIVSIDLFTVGNEQEFLELFARSVIKASSTKWEEWINTAKLYLKQLVPKLSVGLEPEKDFSISFEWSELEKYKEEILNLPEQIAKEKKGSYIICIDEFQHIRDIDANSQLEKRLRSVWQRQKETTYCLYGSKRHMMSDIFSNSSNAFYKFGDLIFLQKIKEEKWITYLTKQFKRTHKSIDKAAAKLIAQSMKNHPWYVQQLAHYSWANTTSNCSEEIVQQAIEQVIQSNTPLFQREIESLSVPQINILKAIIKKEKQLTSKATIERYNLGTSALVIKNKMRLFTEDIIDDTQNEIELLDPVFELYMKQLYRIQ